MPSVADWAEEVSTALNDAFAGTPLLHVACFRRDVRRVQEYCTRDEINAVAHGATPLWIACMAGFDDCAQLLIDANAAVNMAPPDGCTPLHMACWKGSSACVKILIDSSANVEYPKRPLDARPLYVASQCGNAECVQLLIDSGAEVDAGNTQTHCNALGIASAAGSAACVRILISAGADVNHISQPSPDSHNSALVAAVVGSNDHAALHGNYECAQALIEARADVNQEVDGKGAPLIAAVRTGGWPCGRLREEHATACVRLLIDARSNVGHENRDGHFALSMAACNGLLDCVKLMLNEGASVNHSCRVYTALHAAAHYGHTKILRTLLDAQADASTIDARSQTNSTALSAACRMGFIDCVRVLSAWGASREWGPPGTTLPVELAAEEGEHQEIVAWLRATQHLEPLHHLEVLSPGRVRQLLRNGADIHAAGHGSWSTPLATAHKITTDLASGEQRESAQLVLAASVWSESSHQLFPEGARMRAAQLVRIGFLLSRQDRFANNAQAVMDTWRGFVMPHVITR